MYSRSKESNVSNATSCLRPKRHNIASGQIGMYKANAISRFNLNYPFHEYVILILNMRFNMSFLSKGLLCSLASFRLKFLFNLFNTRLSCLRFSVGSFCLSSFGLVNRPIGYRFCLTICTQTCSFSTELIHNYHSTMHVCGSSRFWYFFCGLDQVFFWWYSNRDRLVQPSPELCNSLFQLVGV